MNDLIDFREGDNLADVTFTAGLDPAKYKRYELHFDNLVELDSTVFGPQFVMTLSSDGVNFDSGANYHSSIGYSCNAYAPIPPPSDPINPFQMYLSHFPAKSEGIYLSQDNAQNAYQGLSGKVTVRSPGVVAGLNVDTSVEGVLSRGIFTDNLMPFGHVVWGRWTGAVGSPVKGIRIKSKPASDQQQRNCRGRVELWGINESTQTVPGGGFGPWTPYTPTLAASSGTLGSYSTSGMFRTDGATTEFQATASITNAGNASGVLFVGLPSATYAAHFYYDAGEHAISGALLKGHSIPGSNVAEVLNYNNTAMIATGAVVTINGRYRCP